MLDVFFATGLMSPSYQDTKNGWTPLMYAVKERSFATFKHLIEQYAVDTTVQNEDKEAAFDIARANKQREVAAGKRTILSDKFIAYINEIA